MSFHEYDPDQVDVIFALAPISGFSEDDMVTIEEDEDGFILVTGVDGEFTRSKVKGVSAKVTIKIMSSSRSNDALSAIYEADRLAPGGAGVVPILIRDNNGTSLFASDKAWIIKRPPRTFGKQAVPVEWQIQVIDQKWFQGGT